MCDEAPYYGEVKGSTVLVNARILVFTTNKDPLHWYKWEKDPHAPEAMKRRVKHWVVTEKVEAEYVRTDYGSGSEGWKKFDEHLQVLVLSSTILIQ